MATENKDFKVKNGLIVGNSTNLVNYTSASPSNRFVGQLWISASTLYAWSGSSWLLLANGDASSASGTPFNIANTLVARSASSTFSISGVDFDVTSVAPLAVGRLQWSPTYGTPEIGLIGGNVTSQIGQHNHIYVRNEEGSPLVRGDVVYLFGALGDRVSVKKASNSTELSSAKTLGIVAEPIVTNGFGFITHFGIQDKLNLSSYSSGDMLWLSSSAGVFTNIEPIAPENSVLLGVVTRANAGNGQMFVTISNGLELDELHNVQIIDVTNRDIIQYNTSASLWQNKSLLTSITEVDGAGSGIDSDLLDSFHSSYFINTSSATQEKSGNLTFHGTLTVNELVVSGSSTFIATQDLLVSDSLIFLASEQYTTDALDIGFVGSYGDGTTSSANHYHASFARDASQNKWKLLSNGPAPVNNVIDYSDPSVQFGTLQVSAIEVSSSVTVNNFNSDLLDGQHGLYYQSAATASVTYLSKTDATNTYLPLSGSISWNNVSSKPDPIIGVNLLGDVTGAASATLTDLTNGQISINTTVAANSVALGTDTTGNYVAGATAGNGITISGTVGEGWSPTIEVNGAASVSWGNISSKPDPIIGINLIGSVTGAASATLTDLNNAQITITTSGSYTTTTRWYNIVTASTSYFSGFSNGQTLSYTPGYENIYVNGVLLIRNVDYSASTSNSITLYEELIPGDSIDAISNTIINVADTYSQSQINTLLNSYLSVAASSNYLLTSSSSNFASKNISIQSSSSAIYRLTLNDAGKLIEMNTSASNTILIPTNASVAFPIGTQIDILQVGLGPTTASFDSGVILNSDTNKRTLNSQWAGATIIKRDTNTWVIMGALK